MKLLFDFLPIILFFGTFKAAEGRKDWAAQFASDQFGFMVSGGVVGPNEAPVLLATVVVILATLAQVGWIIARGRKVDTMLWVSLGLVTVFGGATIWFHNETFIKWKPSVLYWVMGMTFWLSQLIFRKNLLRALIGAPKPDLYTLFALHARARGSVVGRRGDAQTVFGVDGGGVTPRDQDRIRAEFMA